MRMGDENLPDAGLHGQGEVAYACSCVNQCVVVEQKTGGAGVGIDAARAS